MTREEALEYIHEWLKDEYALDSKDREALDMAIKALEQKTCEYTISHEIPYNAKGSSLYSEVYTEVYGDE